MDSIAGFQKTGRVTLGPGADLVELTADNGLRHTAVVFHPQYRDHPAIGAALDVIVGFLEAPYVTNMLELVGRDPQQGAFVYPTGQVWSVYEVVRTLADLGQVGGVRAALELMYSAGEILAEAAENGEPNGVYSHGGLTPWRVMLKADGQVEIMGYALPQVEILQFHANPNDVPGEDSFRYCPPERMEAAAEEVSADLFALSLIAFEVMTGKPLYDGLVNDIRTQASRGATSRRLFHFKEELPAAVRDLLTAATRARPQDRFPDGRAFVREVQQVLARPDVSGPSLRELMQTVSRFQRPTGRQLEGAKTQALSKADLARILAEEEDAPTAAPPAAAPGGARAWEPPSAARRPRPPPRRDPGSSGSEPPAPATPPLATPPPATPAQAPPELRASVARPNPRASMARQGPLTAPSTPPVAAAPPPAPTPPAEEAGDDRWGRPDPGRRRRVPRRLQEGAQDEAPPQRIEQPPEPPPPPAPEDLRRLVSSSADAILSAIRTSGSSPSRAPRAGASAADVIESILSGSRPAEPPPPAPTLAPVVSLDEEVSPAPPPAGPRLPRRARSLDELPAFGASPEPAPEPPRPPRSLDELPAFGAPPEAPPPLVAARSVLPEEPPAPAPLPREDTAPLPFTALLEEDDETDAGRDAGPARPGPEPLVFPALHGLPLSPPRPPDALRSDLGGRPQALFLRRGPGGEPFKVRLPGNASLAEAVSYLTGTLIPPRCDLQGRITFGYRLGPAEGPLPGTRRVAELPEDSELTLHPVPARDLFFTLEVRAEGEPLRLRVPLSAAVPLAAVIDHLCAWLTLPAGDWTLSQGAHALSPHLLVDELAPGEPLILAR